MYFSLLGLPIELIREILSFDLSISDLARVQLQNRHLRAIVHDILDDIYRRELQLAALVDCFPEGVPTLRRLVMLRRREHSWAHFKPAIGGKDVSQMNIRAVRNPGSGFLSGFQCDLNGGYFLMGVPSDSSYTALAITTIHYCHLPSPDQFLEYEDVDSHDDSEYSPGTSYEDTDVDPRLQVELYNIGADSYVYRSARAVAWYQL
jgi:hypothetical protein